jgi:hypothetical protein
MKRIMPESDPMAWLVPDYDRGSGYAKRVFLDLDPGRWGSDEEYPLWVTVLSNSESMVPEPLYCGHWARWELPPTTNARNLTEAINGGHADGLLEIIVDDMLKARADRYHCSPLEVYEADEAFRNWLWDRSREEELGGVYDAADWLEPGDIVITANMSDEHLLRTCESIEHFAEAEHYVIVTGCFEYLEYLREVAREKALESAGA